MEHVSNEEKAMHIVDVIREANEKKAKEIATIDAGDGRKIFSGECYYAALEAMEWKDEQHKKQRCIIRNHYQEWAIEQLTVFAKHLNKRGAFRDDLCMDFEHEAQSFIESQNNKEL